MEEKVTALHLLASAERKLVEAQADESGGSSCATALADFLCLPGGGGAGRRVGWVQLCTALADFLCLPGGGGAARRVGWVQWVVKQLLLLLLLFLVPAWWRSTSH